MTVMMMIMSKQLHTQIGIWLKSIIDNVFFHCVESILHRIQLIEMKFVFHMIDFFHIIMTLFHVQHHPRSASQAEVYSVSTIPCEFCYTSWDPDLILSHQVNIYYCVEYFIVSEMETSSRYHVYTIQPILPVHSLHIRTLPYMNMFCLRHPSLLLVVQVILVQCPP